VLYAFCICVSFIPVMNGELMPEAVINGELMSEEEDLIFVTLVSRSHHFTGYKTGTFASCGVCRGSYMLQTLRPELIVGSQISLTTQNAVARDPRSVRRHLWTDHRSSLVQN